MQWLAGDLLGMQPALLRRYLTEAADRGGRPPLPVAEDLDHAARWVVQTPGALTILPVEQCGKHLNVTP